MQRNVVRKVEGAQVSRFSFFPGVITPLLFIVWTAEDHGFEQQWATATKAMIDTEEDGTDGNSGTDFV